ncbi:MAG: polysaccharide biosynthesis/export family protein [Blastocatellia bacterium]
MEMISCSSSRPLPHLPWLLLFLALLPQARAFAQTQEQSSPPAQAPARTQVAEPEKQAQAEPAAEARPRTTLYHLRRGDRISVRFFYHPELNEASVMVRPDGYITLQLVGDVKAAGLTPVELKKNLEESYNEHLLRPEITVILLDAIMPRIYVAGQVQRPGSYELRGAETLLQAVIQAGGFTRDAHRKMVLHARPVGDNKLKVTVVDLMKLLHPEGGESELALREGDYVFVPDSKTARISHVVEAFRFAFPGFTIQ